MSARDVIADHAVWCSAHDDKGRYRDADMLLYALSAAGLDPNDVPRLRAELAAARKEWRRAVEHLAAWGAMDPTGCTAETDAILHCARAALGDAA